MPGTYYLFVEGVRGETAAEDRKDWIEVLAFSWAVTSKGPQTRPDLGDVSVSKFVDLASPELALACAEGREIPTVAIEFVVDGVDGDRVAILTYRLHGCLVSSIQPTGSDGERAIENLTITYAEIEWGYSPQGPDGSYGPAIARSFSLARDPRPKEAGPSFNSPGRRVAFRAASCELVCSRICVHHYVDGSRAPRT